MEMARYQIILAYDGTAFSGLQRQVDVRTVQGSFEKALGKIGWKGASVYAAGRTDTGVHASGQVIVFDHDWAHSTDDLQNALNAVLSSDLAVRQVIEVRADFHPRYDALIRSYRYDVIFQANRNPLEERYAWRIWPKPAKDLLQNAAEQMVGEHDFAPFGTPPKEDGVTIRNVLSAEWVEQENGMSFKVSANAFLYHMVRRMVSISVEIGLGKHEPGIIRKYLRGEIPGMIQGLAPPNGLFLTRVTYK